MNKSRNINPPIDMYYIEKKEINIFLASSSELQEDRDQFEIFIARENKEWKKWGGIP